MPAPDAFWLELLLRQHEVCWRSGREGEARVFLLGNSGPFGFPNRAEEALAGALNAHFDAARIPAHVFNLGMVNAYQLKDALILYQALRYDPDFILYAPTLGDFVHVAPLPYPTISELMVTNGTQLMALGATNPAGLLGKAIERYQLVFRLQDSRGFLWTLRQIGTYVRSVVRQHANRLAVLLSGVAPGPPPGVPTGPYDCTKLKDLEARQFADWQRWNILAWLEQVSRERGIPVLVINWPRRAQPIDGCYNQRHTSAALEEWDGWLRAQTAVSGLAYLDFRQLLAPGDFVDSIHVAPRGHRRIAEALAPTLETMLRARLTAGRSDVGQR